jgi:SAM-dependent methyltransferase
MTLPQPLPFSAAAERNTAPILAVLRQVLPAQARVLEVASGTGQHAAAFAQAEPGWLWLPSDWQAEGFGAIEARTAHLANVLRPVVLDVLKPEWPLPQADCDAVLAINMLHIAPWACCAGLMQGAARHLVPGGCLVTYGPYREATVPTSPGNLAFDADLRVRDADWGLRDLADVTQVAAQAGLVLAQRVAMPANNLLLVFRLSD